VAEKTGSVSLTILLFVSFLRFPLPPACDKIDSSYIQGLGYALVNGMRIGSDYFFTLGPLGYFYTSIFLDELFWLAICWEFGVKFGFALIFVRLSRQVSSIPEKICYFALLAFVIPVIGFDSLYLLALTGAALLMLEKLDQQPALLLVGIVFFSLISLVKFTFFLQSSAAVVILSLAAYLQNHRRLAGILPASFVMMFLLLWILCGQSPSQIPGHMAMSMKLTSGHSEAMISGIWMLRKATGDMPWALAALGLAGTSIFCHGAQRPLRSSRVAGSTLLAAMLFLAWKAGMVRPDVHTAVFFTTAAAIPFMIPSPPSGRGPFLRILMPILGYGCLVVSIAGLFTAGQRFNYLPATCLVKAKNQIVRNTTRLFSLNEFRENQRAGLSRLRKLHRLPRIQNRVGDDPVDLVSFEQGVLLINELNWRPRPIFQSYLTYTPQLLEANAEFFDSSRAPRFVIFKLQSIDNRFPTIDDGLALPVILRRYRRLFEENSYLLLEQRDDVPDRSGRKESPVLQQTISLGERMALDDMPGRVQLLSLDVGYSALGWIRKTLFRAPSLWIKVEIDTGETLKYRIIPSMIRSPFIFNPLVKDQGSWSNWLSGASQPRIVAFRVVAEPGEEAFYRRSLGVTLTTDDTLPVPFPS